MYIISHTTQSCPVLANTVYLTLFTKTFWFHLWGQFPWEYAFNFIVEVNRELGFFLQKCVFSQHCWVENVFVEIILEL